MKSKQKLELACVRLANEKRKKKRRTNACTHQSFFFIFSKLHKILYAYITTKSSVALNSTTDDKSHFIYVCSRTTEPIRMAENPPNYYVKLQHGNAQRNWIQVQRERESFTAVHVYSGKQRRNTNLNEAKLTHIYIYSFAVWLCEHSTRLPLSRFSSFAFGCSWPCVNVYLSWILVFYYT